VHVILGRSYQTIWQRHKHKASVIIVSNRCPDFSLQNCGESRLGSNVYCPRSWLLMRFCDVSFGPSEILDMVTMPRAEIIRTLLDRLKYYKDQDGNVIAKESQSQSKSSSLSFISFGSDLFLLQILTNLKPLLNKL